MSSVGILGAGLSGVLMGMQLRRAGIDDFTIYERRPDVGGTWFNNTYPGLHCDVPTHLYCYSFEPNPDWSMVYSSGQEIQAYIRSCAEKYDLVSRIRFDTSVDSARFDEATGRWGSSSAAVTERATRCWSRQPGSPPRTCPGSRGSTRSPDSPGTPVHGDTTWT